MTRGRRLGLAALVAVSLAGVSLALVRAEDGPYNTNPPYCRTHGPGDLLWWWNACMYPDPPDWGEVGG